jgi:hypothetical protein
MERVQDFKFGLSRIQGMAVRTEDRMLDWMTNRSAWTLTDITT